MRLVERLRKKMGKKKTENNYNGDIFNNSCDKMNNNCDRIENNCSNNCDTINNNCIKIDENTIEIPLLPPSICNTSNDLFLLPIPPFHITPKRPDTKGVIPTEGVHESGVKPVIGVKNQNVKTTEEVENELTLKEVETMITPEGLEIYKYLLPHPPPDVSDNPDLKICISKICNDLSICHNEYIDILDLLFIDYEQYIFAYLFACNLCKKE
jgi:hypothetical protein